jgi:hypothetical protein
VVWRASSYDLRKPVAAANFNGTYRGFHQYKRIWPVEDDPACNWSTS